MERDRMNSLLRLLAEVASAKPRGRHTCHSTGGTRNLGKRTAGTIPGGLQTTQTSRVSSLGTSVIGGGGVLPQRLPRVERKEDIHGHSKVPAD